MDEVIPMKFALYELLSQLVNSSVYEQFFEDLNFAVFWITKFSL